MRSRFPFRAVGLCSLALLALSVPVLAITILHGDFRLPSWQRERPVEPAPSDRPVLMARTIPLSPPLMAPGKLPPPGVRVAVAQEKGKRVYRIQVTHDGDELVVDAETGKLVRVDTSRNKRKDDSPRVQAQ
jgi:hypothetical protein